MLSKSNTDPNPNSKFWRSVIQFFSPSGLSPNLLFAQMTASLTYLLYLLILICITSVGHTPHLPDNDELVWPLTVGTDAIRTATRRTGIGPARLGGRNLGSGAHSHLVDGSHREPVLRPRSQLHPRGNVARTHPGADVRSARPTGRRLRVMWRDVVDDVAADWCVVVGARRPRDHGEGLLARRQYGIQRLLWTSCNNRRRTATENLHSLLYFSVGWD